jgi:hypothetical protein
LTNQVENWIVCNRSPVGSDEDPLEYSAPDEENRSYRQQREYRVKPAVEEIAPNPYERMGS